MLKKYFNPDDLLTTGRKILWGATLTAESFADIANQLRENEHLYAYIEPALGSHKRAPLLGNAARYQAFFSQYENGNFATFDFYAVRADRATEA